MKRHFLLYPRALSRSGCIIRMLLGVEQYCPCITFICQPSSSRNHIVRRQGCFPVQYCVGGPEGCMLFSHLSEIQLNPMLTLDFGPMHIGRRLQRSLSQSLPGTTWLSTEGGPKLPPTSVVTCTPCGSRDKSTAGCCIARSYACRSCSFSCFCILTRFILSRSCCLVISSSLEGSIICPRINGGWRNRRFFGGHSLLPDIISTMKKTATIVPMTEAGVMAEGCSLERLLLVLAAAPSASSVEE